jgi:DNA-binding transcriptional MerR regulator
MKIGELAERSGLSPSRIRFYESSGLLKAVSRQANGYREYPGDALLTLQLIVGAQASGFTLDEIRSLVPPDLTTWKHDELVDGLRRKVEEIEALQKKLAQSKRHLVALIHEVQNKPEGMDCAGNARRLLDRVRGQEQQAAPAQPAVVARVRKRA